MSLFASLDSFFSFIADFWGVIPLAIQLCFVFCIGAFILISILRVLL
jgi:hypothetical protein